MPRPSRYLFVCMLAAALLASGCAEHAAKPSPTGTAASHAGSLHQAMATSANHAKLPSRTGIPACDNYLASYKGCHRAAGLYTPNTLDKHYREIRGTLLKQSRNPAMRSTLAARCISMAKLLKKALHGKPCAPALPANASSIR